MFAPEEVFAKKNGKARGFYYPSPLTTTSQPVTRSHCPASQSTTSVPPDSTTPKTPRINLNAIINDDQNEDVLNKENKVVGGTCVTQDASTSIDKLLRDIDASLASSSSSFEPALAAPTPRQIPDLDQILSVSNNSDTNTSVMSPDSLRFFVDRFKHANPSHPSKRSHKQGKSVPHLPSSGTLPRSGKQEIVRMSDHVLSSSGDGTLSYNSVELDSSSFLNLQLSSDDSTVNSSESTSLSVPLEPLNAIPNIPSSVPNPLNIQNSVPNIHLNSTSYMGNHGNTGNHGNSTSYIEQVTGISLAELRELVPQEIIEPSSESEDILFQWRFRRRVADAKANPPPTTELPNLPTELPLYRETANRSTVHRSRDQSLTNQQPLYRESLPTSAPDLCQEVTSSQQKVNRGGSPVHIKVREVDVQTDKEMYDISCQVNIKSSPGTSPRNLNIPAKSSEKTPTKRLSKGSPIRMRHSPIRKVSKTSPFKKSIFVDESDSEISISSLSDDLTNISDLEEEDMCDDFGDDKQDVTLDNKQDVTLIDTVVDEEKEFRVEFPEEYGAPVTDISPKTNLTRGNSDGNHGSDDDKLQNYEDDQRDDEQLKEYLKNIAETFDDELLTSFIDKYNSVLDKIDRIDGAIKDKTHED